MHQSCRHADRHVDWR